MSLILFHPIMPFTKCVPFNYLLSDILPQTQLLKVKIHEVLLGVIEESYKYINLDAKRDQDSALLTNTLLYWNLHHTESKLW